MQKTLPSRCKASDCFSRKGETLPLAHAETIEEVAKELLFSQGLMVNSCCLTQFPNSLLQVNAEGYSGCCKVQQVLLSVLPLGTKQDVF